MDIINPRTGRPLLNNCVDTDSYKPSHAELLPEGVEKITSYFESRGGLHPTTIFAGLQYFKKAILSQPVNQDDVDFANEFFMEHCGVFPYAAWCRIVKEHGGFMPMKIDAVPEGLEVPTHNMLVRVTSTDENIPWIGGWAETQLVRLWYTTNVATQSYYIKKLLLEGLIRTCEDPWKAIYFMLHDFGGRGASCREAAAIGGMVHLFNFRGSDTVPGVLYANQLYHCKMAGYSIPASEHSTILLWGGNEDEAYRNLIKKYLKAGKMVACVSDTTDYFRVLNNVWCGEHLETIKNSKGTLVVRPDSGKPVEILEQTFRILEEKVGMRVNSKGFKVLPPYIRVIQGDGVNETSIREITEMMIRNNWSLENITFGMGGALLQKHDRDTQKFAFKPCFGVVDGVKINLAKNPKTDPGKRSKAGDLVLVKENGIYQTIPRETTKLPDILVPQWCNGRDFTDYTMEEVRDLTEFNLRLMLAA